MIKDSKAQISFRTNNLLPSSLSRIRYSNLQILIRKEALKVSKTHVFNTCDSELIDPNQLTKSNS